MAPYLSLLVASTFALVCTSAEQPYQREALSWHNIYRAAHGSPSLRLDVSMNNRAVLCARHYAKIGILDHSCPYATGVGENLGSSTSIFGSPALSAATKTSIDNWYKESKNYNYKFPKRSRGVTKEFTQLVWKGSTALGFAAHQDYKSKRTYVVALYSPAGNMQLFQRWNVGPPSVG